MGKGGIGEGNLDRGSRGEGNLDGGSRGEGNGVGKLRWGKQSGKDEVGETDRKAVEEQVKGR